MSMEHHIHSLGETILMLDTSAAQIEKALELGSKPVIKHIVDDSATILWINVVPI